MKLIRLPVSMFCSATRFTIVWLLVFCGLLCGPLHGIQFLTERSDAGDLEIAFADDGKRSVFIPREKLYSMGAEKKEVYIPYTKQNMMCTVLPLTKLFAYFDLDETAAASAESYDGYYSVYPSEFNLKYEPYLVIDLEGLEMGNMQLEGAPDLGPYYITFAKDLKQGSSEMPDPDNKRPYGVSKMTLGSYDAMFGFLYTGPFEALNASEALGRSLYFNNCMSCHAWTPEGPGGNFSNRTAPILSVHAKFNRDYFVKYIVNPAEFIPDVKMPKHPHYDAEKIQALADFLAKVPM